MNHCQNTLGQPSPVMQDEIGQQAQALDITHNSSRHPNGTAAGIVAPTAPQPEQWLNIPAALRDRPQWCLAGADKRPLTADSRAASSTDPTTWTDFATACAAARERSLHIGYMLHESDPFTCIDLDVKDDTSPEHIERFDKIVEVADSYTEQSRSGKGLHVWVYGKIGAGVRRDGVEVYSQERFIICTGNAIIDKPIQDGLCLLDRLVTEMRGKHQSIEPLTDGEEIELDDAILQRAHAAANADKFNAHYRGDFAAIGHSDHSAADMALLQMLAHFTRNNAQLKRLFLGSALGQRDKATKRGDYVDRTIHAVRIREASGPNVAHGERIALAIISSELMKRLHPSSIPVSEQGIRLISEDEMVNRPQVRWRVRDVIPEEGVVAVYGPPGSGKSFLVLDMIGAISTGRKWFDHKVRPAPVVYAALEGKAGVSQRVRAYRAKRGHMNGVKFIDAAVDLRRLEDRNSVVHAIREAGWNNGVLCIDTLAASAPGMDENTSTDMGKMVAALQEIQEALGGCVLVVHHTGKDQSKGLRGWSGLTGALDGAIEVVRNGHGREWKIAKAKDGEDGNSMSFELETVVLDLDEDGLPITSCVVVSGESPAAQDEVAGQVLALIREYYDRGEYIATAHNSPNSAYKMLKDDPQFPRAVSSKVLTTLLREAERAGLVVREAYTTSQRNTRERWQVI